MKRRLSSLEKQALLKEFEKHLDEVMDGKVSFSKTITLPEKIKVYYTPEAFSKTVRLIMSHSMEVAWHCLVRKKDKDYEVYDVLSYPQTVGPAHVHVKMGRTFGDGNPKDPTKYYTDWYNEVVLAMSEEDEANFCGQCHSHVNMGTEPSTVDMAQQKGELELKGGKGYYLFQIWNKHLEVNSFLYDLDAGVIYEKGDIEIVVEDDEFTTASHKMLYEAKPEVSVHQEKKEENKKYKQEKTWDGYSYNSYGSYYDDYYPYDSQRYSGRLYNYAISVGADDIYVDIIVEARTAVEADYYFGNWTKENKEYLHAVLLDAGAKDVSNIEIGKAVWCSAKEPIDVSYDELIGAEYS